MYNRIDQSHGFNSSMNDYRDQSIDQSGLKPRQSLGPHPQNLFERYWRTDIFLCKGWSILTCHGEKEDVDLMNRDRCSQLRLHFIMGNEQS